jgi:hypothetical protein
MSDDQFTKLDLEPDFKRLDEQISDQPRLMQVWTERDADAKLDEDEAKADMERIQSKISLSIRKEPNKYGLEKVTDKAVEAIVATQKAYIAAQKSYFEAVRHKSAVKGVVSALHDRRSGLENLVRLHAQQWFSEVRLSAEDQQVVNRQRSTKPLGTVIRKKRKRKDAQ